LLIALQFQFLRKKSKDDTEVKEFAEKRLIVFYYNSLLYSPDEVLTAMKRPLQPSHRFSFRNSTSVNLVDLNALR